MEETKKQQLVFGVHDSQRKNGDGKGAAHALKSV